MPAQDGDRFVDRGVLGVAELGDVAFDPVDEPPDASDFFLRRRGVGACPVIDPVDDGGEALAAAQQIVEVSGEVRQVGDVGAEMVAAGAAEPDGACAAAGGDVGRLAAPAVGDGDLADRVAGPFIVQQVPDVAPDPLPCRSNCIAATLSTASRRRSSPIR